MILGSVQRLTWYNKYMMRYHHDQYLLAFFQTVSHLALIYVIFFGSINNWLLTLLGFFLLGCLGSVVTFHRLLSHRSWNSPRWFEILGTVLGNLSIIGSSISWVALHRQHHRYADREGDPHTPKEGFLKAQWGAIFEVPNLRYVPDLLKKPLHLFLHKHYFLIITFTVIILAAIDPILAASLYLAPVALVYTIGGAVNSFNHSDILGYKNYETKDNSKNIWLLGLLMWGEGWHNNHHADPSQSCLRRKWWEFDVSGWIIKRLEIK